jgi:ribosomal protein S6E (S10)
VSEQWEVLRIVAERLTDAGIPYMVTGSTALNHYAVPRMTRAIDIVVALVAADADRVCTLFGDDFYLDGGAIRSAIESQRMFNVIHMTLLMKVDVVVRKDSQYRRTEFGRRRRVSVDGQEVFIVAPEDLILSKLEWARDSRSAVQLDDVRSLLASVTDLDRGYLAERATRLGLDALYREVGG